MNAELDRIKARYPEAQTFKLGDSQTLCDELLTLVRSGAKTATCGALRDFPEGSADMPKPGRRDIALEWDGRPALVIETVDVSIRRFCDVTEDFALAEGENDTLDGWRDGHRRYFERNGGFDPKMELVCERFHLIEDLAAEG
ncbi:ASCH domain-containing protein [Ruegeria atlantica]|uniref:ASCH domain-containing protein n=1 Tax=Ruegeria atlantica TaxID=81569 RepID=UPI00147F8BF5|nr:ASCH domain-containing protein [Ruegeria atlantica]